MSKKMKRITYNFECCCPDFANAINDDSKFDPPIWFCKNSGTFHLDSCDNLRYCPWCGKELKVTEEK